MALPSLLLVLVALVVTGCGGNSTPATPANPVFTVAFSSTGALDGSNGPNTNSTSNIWVASTDGSGATPLTRLTASSAAAQEPVWSPDGKKLAFVSLGALDGSDATNTAPNIWIMNADGSGAAPLTRFTNSGITVWELVWSPDGSKLAFVSPGAFDGSDAPNANGTVNVWVMNADGTGAIPLTRLTVNVSALFIWTNAQLVWSPDSSKIAFLSAGALDGTNALNTNEVFNIWVAQADGTGTSPLTRLTASGAWQSYPAWSPDGTKIAFVAQRALDGSDAPDLVMNLWTINADGSGATPLTRFVNSHFLFYPAWSPDGAKLAFGSDQALDGNDAPNVNSTDNVWTINADGTGAFAVSRLTASVVNAAVPMVWSPDGRQIAFPSTRAVDGTDAANPSGDSNVWIFNADGSGAVPLTTLTSSTAASTLPSWKP